MKVGIFASGSGSNAVALIKAMQSGKVAAEPAVVFSNNPDAGVLQKATQLGVPTESVDHKPYKGDRSAFEAQVSSVIAPYNLDLICNAGFMRILTADFVKSWDGRMLNIHPSLLPKYPGLNTHQRAMDAGDKIAGCTVHVVIPELDAGPILGQRQVPIFPDDTAQALAARVLVEEHKLYPECLASYIRSL